MDDYKEIREMLEQERKNGAFIYMPSPILSMENSFYMPVVEKVVLRDDEVYSATKKYRIHYNGLLRIAAAAGFEWSAIDTCRTDGRTDKLYCSFRAVGGVRKADGKVYFHKAEKDIDLEVLEMEFEDQYKTNWQKVKACKGNENWKKQGHTSEKAFVSAMVRRDMIQKRKNKLMLVESGAKARVIRFVLGLQSQYTNKNQVLGMPFIMVHYALNPKHPDVRKALTGSFAESQNLIYGGVKDTGQIEYIDPDHDNPSVVDVPTFEPEPEPEPDQEQEQEQGDNTFEPTSNAEPTNGNMVDFENSDIGNQIKSLKHLCKKIDYDYDYYEKQVKGGVAKANQQWRSDLFIFLNSELENKK